MTEGLSHIHKVPGSISSTVRETWEKTGTNYFLKSYRDIAHGLAAQTALEKLGFFLFWDQ